MSGSASRSLPSHRINDEGRARSVFLSHGVSLLAVDDTWPSTIELRQALAPIGREAHVVVIVSAHWQADVFSITADRELPVVEEGLPTELLGSVGPVVGSPALTQDVAERLEDHGLPTRLVEGRGLDHGATIAVRLLDLRASTPVVQISLRDDGDPIAHLELGRALRGIDGLVVASGGAVHNLATLERFAPYETPPPDWAVRFRASFRRAAESDHAEAALIELMTDPAFVQSHPTSEHFLPVLVHAGTGGDTRLVHDGWQWSSLAMTTYVATD